MLANFLVPILSDGWRFIALFAVATLLAALTGIGWLFWPLFVVTLWSIYFFRDPSRAVPQEDRAQRRGNLFVAAVEERPEFVRDRHLLLGLQRDEVREGRPIKVQRREVFAHEEGPTFGLLGFELLG